MKHSLFCRALLILGLATSVTSLQATLVVEYQMGEIGSVNGSLHPLDTVGPTNMSQGDTGGVSVVAPGTGGAPASTAALFIASNNNSAFYVGSPYTFDPGSDWVLDIWFNPGADNFNNSLNPSLTTGLFATSFGINGLVLTINNGNYVASYAGGSSLTGTAATAGAWANLQVSNTDTTSTFSIDGISQGTFTSPGTVDWNGFVVGVVGGGYRYTGSVDELTLTAVPEPGTWSLVTTSLCVALIFRRRSPSWG